MRTLKLLPVIISCLFFVAVFYSCKKSKPVTPVVTLPPANLIAYWPLNGNANDASRYGNSGTAFNTVAVADRFGNANSALQFNGGNSYIAVPDSVRLRLGNTDFTLNAWMKLDAYNSSAVSAIISKRFSGVDNGWIWGVNGSLNTPLGAVYYGPGGGNSDAISASPLSIGQWYMISCVYTLSTQTLQIYINGQLNSSKTGIATANNTVNASLYIGMDQTSPGQQQYFFNGTLDEIRIYNTALDLTLIQQLYNATK